MVGEINAYMREIGAPLKLHTFASLWRNVFTEDLPYGDLFYAMLRDRGIHILDNFPCFLTTAHSAADVAAIVAAYKAAADEMQASGFFPVRTTRAPADREDVGGREAPSTEPQREVWLADKLSPEASLAYNEASRCTCVASSTSARFDRRCASCRRDTTRCARRSPPMA